LRALGKTYVEAGLVEEDVVLLVVDLQELACSLCAFWSQAFDVVLGLLGSFEVDTRSGGHGPRNYFVRKIWSWCSKSSVDPPCEEVAQRTGRFVCVGSSDKHLQF
jgi:hypothetical protein